MVYLKMRALFIFAVVMLSMAGIATANFFYEPMNFQEAGNHSFNVSVTGFINVTIPDGFSVISGNTSGTDSVAFIVQSPTLNATESRLFVGEIRVNGSFYAKYYFLYVDPLKIVDTKVEIGHGDFNYIDYNSYIGEETTMLFNIVRVWGVGSDIWNEPARDVRFNCSFPPIIPSTVDSKYTTAYNETDIIATGYLGRLEGLSMFRVFVLSQEIIQEENTTYEVDCTDLSYEFDHTRIVAPIPGIALRVRSLEPLVISMSNESGYVSYSFLNDEEYDIRNVEFTWKMGTDTVRKEIGSIASGEIVMFDIRTNASGTIDVKARFIPEWMFNSRSPTYLEQSRFDSYYAPDYLDGLATMTYFGNQSVENTPILETQRMSFAISTFQNPPFGGAFKLTYSFYENGVRVDEVERQIIGVQDHLISFSSTELSPAGIEGHYDVYTTVSVRDEDGDWHDFPAEFIGVQTVAKLTSNAPKSQVGYYDVIVNTRSDRYADDHSITADILIKNTGDVPDEDTILTYYLISPDGERFGETKEQILEVPPGTTILTRTITLPLGAEKGEWKFHVDYETVVQPVVAVYNPFEVVTGLTIKERTDIFINDFSMFGWKLVWIVSVALFIVLYFILVFRRWRKHK